MVELKAAGGAGTLDDKLMSFDAFNELMGLSELRATEQRFIDQARDLPQK